MKWISLLAVVLLIPIASHAAPPKSSSQDDSWLVAAHQTNLAEIQSGKLAAQSGHADAIRNAGRMLAKDHAMLDARLRPVAKQLGVKLPSQPNLAQRNQMKSWRGLTGVTFDRTWAHDEADDHVLAIEVTEREIQHGSLPQVKQLAKAALPILKKHLRALHAAATQLTGS